MKRVARVVGYGIAFTTVMPRISYSLLNNANNNNMLTVVFWYAAFIIVVEGSVKLFNFIFPGAYNLNDLLKLRSVSNKLEKEATKE